MVQTCDTIIKYYLLTFFLTISLGEKKAVSLQTSDCVLSISIVRPANRDWACQTERCHTLSNKASLQ